ncbi:MAG: SDR family oxidoreductase [Candidatus Omnitrophica bacterium]|nr:SDR family oxidoreductase [Candidatus Omnitrophota bacterium]
MNVLITGGAGFIGSQLCDYFIREGARVFCLDNLITGEIANIQHLLKHPRFEFIRQDVTQHIKIADPVDYVLHFASPASPVDYAHYPIQTLKVGSLGTHNTLGVAKAKNAVYLLASTSEIYGDPLVHPQKESYWGNVNPIGPRGVYDEAKRFAEALTMAYHREHRVSTRIVRIFNTYGPRMRKNDGRAIPSFITNALQGVPPVVYGDGSQTRSFCYIDDLIEGMIRLIHSPSLHEPVNLGDIHEISVVDLAHKVLTLAGRPLSVTHKPLPVDDPRVRRPDITTAKTLLKWEPKISLEEGLRTTLRWFELSSQKQDVAS